MKNTLIVILMLLSFKVLSQNMEQQINSLLDSKFNNGPAVSVLVTKNFSPVYSLIKGEADIENKIAAHENSKFRIGSVSKQFTAIGILKLMEEGKLTLSDSIQKYLPHFPVKSHTITIEHLLTHTSGLKEVSETEAFFADLMMKGCDPDTLVNYFKDYPLQFEPGTRFQYCNSGYHLLGLIIEKISGSSYDVYMKDHILAIAGMDNTVADKTGEIIPYRVSGYETVNGKLSNATFIDMSIPFSAGNLLSTTTDLNKWYQALFEYKIISKETLEKAHSPYRFKNTSLSNYGYGWFVDSLQGEKIISHEGGINGFLSSVWYMPSKKTLSVVLSNCMCNPTTNTAKKVLAIAVGKPLAEKKRLSLDEATLSKYTGVYEMDGEKWMISIKEGELHVNFENGNGHPVYASSSNEFFAEEWDAQFIFIENQGAIELQFVYLGEIFSGKRISSLLKNGK